MSGGGRWIEHRVTAEEAGRTLEEVLKGEMGLSGRMIQRLTRARGILLNRRPGYLRRPLREGDVVTARVKTEEEPSLPGVAMPLAILHEDEEAIVLDKPAGLLVHPTSPNHQATLAHGLAHHYESRSLAIRVRPVHRLDRETSGTVLFAKSAFAHQHLDRQLRERSLKREYLALVEGRVESDAGTIEAPIGRAAGDPRRRAIVAGGQPALTRYEVAERLEEATLLRVWLESGRTHQIRVHLAHLGHPVVGDSAYGASRPMKRGRIALHAARLDFLHPRSGAAIQVEAPLPEDLNDLVERLR